MYLRLGTSHDVFGLLSASGRDFLIRNNGDQVGINSLIGKTIGICTVPLKEKKGKGHMYEIQDLIHCYNNLKPSGKFEVVLVAVVGGGEFDGNKDRDMFRHCFSNMPWLAIPCQDIASRKRLAQIDFLSEDFGTCTTIIDPNGTVLTHSGLRYIGMYGPECFPFTQERFEELRREDRKAWKEATLTSLLTSSNRDYLLNRKRIKVPARDLEGSVVGLYFYNTREDLFPSLTNMLYMSVDLFPSLTKMYETLKKRGEKFEIVMINTNNWKPDEIDFMKAFQKMPWLAWPLSDKTYKRLSSRFFRDLRHRMVMIGPNMEFVDEYGLEVFCEYGIEAYPFTRKTVAQMQVDKMKAKSLESVLMSYGHQHVMTKDGTKVEVSELQGKRIALFMGALFCKKSNDFLEKLIDFYGQIKKKDDTFEIIYVSWDEDEDSYNQNYLKMPWLALPFQEDTTKNDSFNYEVFKASRYNLPKLIAFGSDGRFLTKQARAKLLIRGLDAYPFNDDELLEDTLREVISDNMWPTAQKAIFTDRTFS